MDNRTRVPAEVVPIGNTSTYPVCGVWDETLGHDPSAFEEYRFDALGRRVLVRRRLYEVNGTCARVITELIGGIRYLH